MVNSEQQLTKYAGFLIPIIDGKIWVGQRGTEPHKGLYGPIGGKSEPPEQEHTQHPAMVYAPGDHQRVSLTDLMAESEGREIPAETRVREFCEEVFTGLHYPADFSSQDITGVGKLGWIIDSPKPDVDFVCYFYLAKVGRKDFRPSPRELTAFKPLEQLAADERLFPIARYAFAHLKWLYECRLIN